MRSHHFTAALVLGVIGWSAQAFAATYDPALDQTFVLNNGDPFDVGSTPILFTIEVDPSPNTVVGFSFQGTLFINPTGFPGLPRHTQLTITTPDASTYIVGGDPPVQTPWDFQTQSGAFNVTYHHGLGGDAWGGDGLPDFGLPDSPAGGTWQFSFVRSGNPFPTVMTWSNVSITLHSVPTPSTGLMLALGLACRRRRRRSA